MKKIKKTLLVLLGLSIVGCQKVDPTPEPVRVTAVTLNTTSITIFVGKTVEIVASISPANAENKKILWTSSNSSIAVVDEGKVTAVKEGRVTITATSEDGGKTASADITVVKNTDGAQLVRVITEYPEGGYNVSDIQYDKKGRIVQLTGGELSGYDGKCSLEYDDTNNLVRVEYANGWSEVLKLDDSGFCIEDYGSIYTYFGGHLVKSGHWSYTWDDDCLTGINYNGDCDNDISYENVVNPFYGCSYDPFCFIDDGAFSEAMSLGFCGMSSKKLYKSYFGLDFSYVFSENGRLTQFMESIDGEVQSITYLSYSDEKLREPRDEGREKIPSTLIGDWIITGQLIDDEEVPGFVCYGMSYGEVYDIDAGIEIFRINSEWIQGLPVEVDETLLNYSNCSLYGIISQPYDLSHRNTSVR